MVRKEDQWEHEMWTQSEVAKYFRVASGTVKNWREMGLLPYWKAPGSSKILFISEDIRVFKEENVNDVNNGYKKGGDKPKSKIKVVKPSIPSLKEKWRI